MCEHERFNTKAQVFRLLGPEGWEFNVELSVECADCGQEFEFEGLPADLLARCGEGIGRDQTKARLPVRATENGKR